MHNSSTGCNYIFFIFDEYKIKFLKISQGRNLASGEQAHHLSNCSLFYKCHVTTILTLSCDGFNPYFDPCNLECQSNDDYCLRTSCGVSETNFNSYILIMSKKI